MALHGVLAENMPMRKMNPNLRGSSEGAVESFAASDPTSFASLLRAAGNILTATQIATATGASKRTVENWRAGRNAPNAREWPHLLKQVKRAANRKRC